MKRKKRLMIVFLILIIFLFYNYFKEKNKLPWLFAPTLTISPTIVPTVSSPSATLIPNRVRAKVIRVIDGDTIEIENGIKVRYIGVDTPETVDPKKPEQCYGKIASDKNKELVEGKEIELEKDISETDRYKRLLRYVYIDGLFINDYLVRQGYAYPATFPPDVKYAKQFIEAQKEARENNRGLWKECNNL